MALIIYRHRRTNPCRYRGLAVRPFDDGTGWLNISMNKSKHCMTLRLPPEIAEEIENRAFEKHVSQAAWIRRAIHSSLWDALKDGLQHGRKPATGGRLIPASETR